MIAAGKAIRVDENDRVLPRPSCPGLSRAITSSFGPKSKTWIGRSKSGHDGSHLRGPSVITLDQRAGA